MDAVNATVLHNHDTIVNGHVGEDGRILERKFGDLFIKASVQLPSGERVFA